MKFSDDRDGKGIYSVINWKKVYFSEDQKDKILKGCFYENGEIIETPEYKILEIDRKIEEVNANFDREIDAFLSKYPKREQETFTKKYLEAKNVIEGGSSVYIESKAEMLGIEAVDFAKIIIAKNDEYTKLYTDIETQKDIEVSKLEAEKANLEY